MFIIAGSLIIVDLVVFLAELRGQARRRLLLPVRRWTEGKGKLRSMEIRLLVPLCRSPPLGFPPFSRTKSRLHAHIHTPA